MRGFAEFLGNIAVAVLSLGAAVWLYRWSHSAAPATSPAAPRAPESAPFAPLQQSRPMGASSSEPPAVFPSAERAAPLSKERSGEATAPAAEGETVPAGQEAISGRVVLKGERGAVTEKLEVCARSFDTGKTRCLGRLKYSGNGAVSYRLVLEPGNYLVFAREPYGDGYKKAYYTEFAECFLKRTGCRSSSREAIPVVLGAGKAVSGIDPIDWGGYP